jgi:hypothetical protein
MLRNFGISSKFYLLISVIGILFLHKRIVNLRIIISGLTFGLMFSLLKNLKFRKFTCLFAAIISFLIVAESTLALPAPDHEWLFDGNLSDTGSYVIKYDLVSTGTPVYTSNTTYTPPSNLASFGQSLNNTAGDQWYRNENFLDDIKTRYGSTGFTIELWYYDWTPTDNYGYIFSKNNGGGNYIYIYKSKYRLMTDIAVNNTRVLYDQTPSFSPSGPWVHYILMMAPNGTLYLRAWYPSIRVL